MSCKWNTLGSGQPEPGLQLDSHCDPKTLSGQGPAKEPRAKEQHLHSGHLSSSREALAYGGRQCGDFPPGHPDLPRVLHTPSTSLHGNSTRPKNSFPSTARSPQLLAFKMSRQAYITGSKKYVAWQTQPAGAKQGVFAPAALHTCSTPALEAMNSLNPSSNRAVTCLSPKEKKSFYRLFFSERSNIVQGG